MSPPGAAVVPEPEPEPEPESVAEQTEPLVYLSARVPKSLRTELQMYAVRNDQSVASLVQTAVRAFLDVHKGT
jgi:hypothetical protein